MAASDDVHTEVSADGVPMKRDDLQRQAEEVQEQIKEALAAMKVEERSAAVSSEAPK